MAAILSIDTTTKQRSAEAGRWEDFFLSFGTAKKQKEGYGISFKRPPLAETTQQPTEISTSDGVGIRDKIRPWRKIWEGLLPVVLDGNSSNEK